jgi:hypothetical protein
MSKVPKSRSVWFLPNTRDPLDITIIQLGSVIASPWKPEEALNDDRPPEINARLIRRREETSWSWTREVEHSAGGSVLASFLQLLGIGGEIGSTVDKSHTNLYTVERMVTEEFMPDKEYFDSCIQDLGVRDSFTGPGRKSKAYIVTGLKTAYGATKVTETMRKRSLHGGIGVDGSAAGVPASLGLQGHWSSSVGERSAADKSDFVFGFKLRRLRLKKSELTHEAYDRGAQYGLGGQSGSMNGDNEELDANDFDLEELEAASPEEFRMKSRDVASLEDREEIIQVYYPILL